MKIAEMTAVEKGNHALETLDRGGAIIRGGVVYMPSQATEIMLHAAEYLQIKLGFRVVESSVKQ